MSEYWSHASAALSPRCSFITLPKPFRQYMLALPIIHSAYSKALHKKTPTPQIVILINMFRLAGS